MALDNKKQKAIEQYFDMGTGYVLHYSNRTFAEFFEQFDLNIYDDKYSDIGDSKAKRLRSFFSQHNDALIGKVLLEMIEEYDIERDSRPYSFSNHNDALRQRCLDIANQLMMSTDQAQVPTREVFKNPFKAQPQQPTYQPSQVTAGWAPRKQSTAQLKPTFVPQQVNQMQNSQPNSAQQSPTLAKEKIFIVHGHDEHLLSETENLCRKLNLDPIILKNQHSGGRTIIEKLEANSAVKYAVILYTACDEGRKIGEVDFNQRARQNVVFEHGYFIGKLGRGNVAAVVKGNVEIQGDIGGVVYVPYIGGWQFNLAKEMQGSGLTVDLNKV